MVDTAKIENEVEKIASETSSVISSLIGTWNPRWPRFVETWRSWSRRKKGIAIVLAAALCGFVMAFGVSTLRLVSGSYRSAYAYSHGQNITRADLMTAGDATLAAAIASAPTKAQFSDLEAKVHQLEINLDVLGDQLAKQPAKITTGSIAKKKKPAPVKSSASSWFNLP